MMLQKLHLKVFLGVKIYSPPGGTFYRRNADKIADKLFDCRQFFYGNNKFAAPESFLYAALWGGFLFCVRPGPLIMPSNVPHIIKNPGSINPGFFHFRSKQHLFFSFGRFLFSRLRRDGRHGHKPGRHAIRGYRGRAPHFKRIGKRLRIGAEQAFG